MSMILFLFITGYIFCTNHGTILCCCCCCCCCCWFVVIVVHGAFMIHHHPCSFSFHRNNHHHGLFLNDKHSCSHDVNNSLIWNRLYELVELDHQNDNQYLQEEEEHDGSIIIKTKKKKKRGGGKRNILSHRHIDSLFSSTNSTEDLQQTSFETFAKVVCQSQVISKKELYETWASALQIQTHCINNNNNNNITRIADLACGHGLLSWALLVLLNNNNSTNANITAICIDVQMSKSAKVLSKVMMKEYPQFQQSWHFIQQSISSSSKSTTILPHPQTLLVGIHACGTLSDDIQKLSIQGNAPCVLLPCCHSKQSLTLHNKTTSSPSTMVLDLSSYIDELRCLRWKQAGFHVLSNVTIPELITPKNKLLIAFPPSTESSPMKKYSKLRMLPPPQKNSEIQIPLGSDQDSLKIVKQLAGSIAAQERNRINPPKFCISIFLPSTEETGIRTQVMEELARTLLSTTEYKDILSITIKSLDQIPYIHPKTGKKSQTFQIIYTYQQKQSPTSTTDAIPSLTKHEFQSLFQQLRNSVPIWFPGCIIR